MSKITANFTRLTIGLLLFAAVVPLLPLGAWTVRLFDFPRIQLAALVVIPVAGLFYWSRATGWSVEHTGILGLCGIVAAWQLSHVAQYTGIWEPELVNWVGADDHILTVTVVNLDYENAQKAAVRDQIANHQTDLLLLIEIDDSWRAALSDLESSYPHRRGVVRGEGLGIMLWSKLPFVKSEVWHLVSEKRASVFAELRIAGQSMNFVGVHPTPPGLPHADGDGRHDSRIRDAELMSLAKIIAGRRQEKWIVTGDFNDVAWSHTSRVFKRISGLKDPRVGRGLYNSYHSEYPLIRFPIDQVFLSPGARIAGLRRFHPVGSDHFAIETRFALDALSSVEPHPQSGDLKEASEMIEDGKADARQQDTAASSESAS